MGQFVACFLKVFFAGRNFRGKKPEFEAVFPPLKRLISWGKTGRSVLFRGSFPQEMEGFPQPDGAAALKTGARGVVGESARKVLKDRRF